LGWLGHDYSHHAVFQSVFANDAVSAVCGWLQGYELYWWKARHNTHHISTNEEGNDPDIVLMPLFHYVFGRTSVANSLNFLQRQQAFYFIPTLALLNVYWRVESLMFVATASLLSLSSVCSQLTLLLQVHSAPHEDNVAKLPGPGRRPLRLHVRVILSRATALSLLRRSLFLVSLYLCPVSLCLKQLTWSLILLAQ
jgi:hypothetical protein